MKLRGVIFDMDGVLVDSGPAHLESWQALAREYSGQPITPGQFAATFGQRSYDIIRALLGVDDPDEIRRLDDRKEAIYRDLIRDAVPVMPGAIECVRRLHAAGLSLAIGSSGPPENIRLVCEGMSLQSAFAAIITGADVTRGKPDPQVFQLAAERLALAPGECVVVEDAAAGVEAAHRAGMPCIALARDGAGLALRAADRIIDHLDRLTIRLLEDLERQAR